MPELNHTDAAGQAGDTIQAARIAAVQPSPTLPADLIGKLATVDRFAVEQLADFEGPCAFNPLIGCTPDETFDQLEMALGAMSAIIENGGEIDSTQLCRAVKVMTDCMWSAAQYEAFRAKRNGKESESIGRREGRGDDA